MKRISNLLGETIPEFHLLHQFLLFVAKASILFRARALEKNKCGIFYTSKTSSNKMTDVRT